MNNPPGSNHGSARRSAMSAAVHPLCSGCQANAALLTRSSSASSSGPAYVAMRTSSGMLHRRQVGQRATHLQQLAHHGQAERGRHRARRLEVAVRPDAGAGPALGQPDARHRRADAAAPGPRMHDQLGHCGRVGARRREVQVPDDRRRPARRRRADVWCGRRAARAAPDRRPERRRRGRSPRRSGHGSAAGRRRKAAAMRQPIERH